LIDVWQRRLVPVEFYADPVGEPNVWSVACLPTPESDAADLSVNGFELSCAVPDGTGAEPPGATPFGLLAASLSACTAMSVRTFLQRWEIDPGAVTVRVGVHPSTPPMLDRRVTVACEVGRDLREQLAAVVDSTPVTVLLRDALTIRTELTTGDR
jgi:putative redox protein